MYNKHSANGTAITTATNRLRCSRGLDNMLMILFVKSDEDNCDLPTGKGRFLSTMKIIISPGRT